MQYTSCYMVSTQLLWTTSACFSLSHPFGRPLLGHPLNKHSELITTIHQARDWAHFILTLLYCHQATRTLTPRPRSPRHGAQTLGQPPVHHCM